MKFEGWSQLELLSSEELTIIDVAAFHLAHVEHYFEPGFCETYNVPHSGASNDFVLRIIEVLTKKGLVRIDSNENVFLTDFGGQTWEYNRKPDWQKYIESYGGKDEIKIIGLSPTICCRFLYHMIQIKDISAELLNLQSAYRKGTLTYWKKEEQLFEIDCQPQRISADCGSGDEDWREKNRFWWSSVSELIPLAEGEKGTDPFLR